MFQYVLNFFRRRKKAVSIVLTAALGLCLYGEAAYMSGIPGEEAVISEEEEAEEETEITGVIEEPETAEVSLVSLSGSSTMEDLKIKIKDEADELVEGTAFEITVAQVTEDETAEAESGTDEAETGEEAAGSAYTDEDMDGIIYISSIEAGDYAVTLSETEGYEAEEATIYVTVEDEIEYTVIDVSDEIKDESEVNAAKEDGESKTKSGSSSSSSSSSSVLASTKTVRSVSRSDVNTSSFPSSSKSGSASGTLGDITFSMASSAVLYNSDLSKSNSASLSVTASSTGTSYTYTWASSNTGVVSVSGSGSSATITYAGNGTATVTVTISAGSSDEGSSASSETTSITLTCTVTCQNYSGTTQLTDTSGNLLYIDEDATTAATIADYMSYTTFYLTPLYTGWQTINGSVYYYNENHVAVTGIQTIGGTVYTFADDGMLQSGAATIGIDVSKYQGTIDWSAVKKAGIDFVIIRVGYRGYTSGTLVEDPYFETNIAGATAAGIKVGVYFFTQAITEAEAVEEASMAVKLVSGYKLTYPIFIDTESVSGGRAQSLSVSQRTKIVTAFCKTVKNAGYKAGVYASKSWYNNQLTASSLSSYYIWVAQYNTSCTYTGKYDMWQYSSKGSVNGISGNVDMDISYLGF